MQGVRKDRNNQEHKYEESHIRWSKERNEERTKAEETLQAERVGRHHTEEELGETKAQLKDVSFKLLLAEETERKRIAQEIHDGIGQHWSTVKLQVENVLEQLSNVHHGQLKNYRFNLFGTIPAYILLDYLLSIDNLRFTS